MHIRDGLEISSEWMNGLASQATSIIGDGVLDEYD